MKLKKCKNEKDSRTSNQKKHSSKAVRLKNAQMKWAQIIKKLEGFTKSKKEKIWRMIKLRNAQEGSNGKPLR